MTASLVRITLFPIKSFDGVEVDRARVLANGALAYDRRWAFIDDRGRYINGKNRPDILRIRSTFSAALDSITLQTSITGPCTFSLDDRAGLEAWMGTYLNEPVILREDRQGGFPDDPESPGPTIVSTATLERVASWFTALTIDEIRRRLRTNLEIDGVSAFWEDQLFAEDPQHTIQFQLGNFTFAGVNPCQRCSVPTRDSRSGEQQPSFQKIFIEKRRETLPDWAAKSRFNHYYKLTVNTRLIQSIAAHPLSELRLNDRLTILP